MAREKMALCKQCGAPTTLQSHEAKGVPLCSKICLDRWLWRNVPGSRERLRRERGLTDED